MDDVVNLEWLEMIKHRQNTLKQSYRTEEEISWNLFRQLYFLASAKPSPNSPPNTSKAPPAIAASFLNSLLISLSMYSWKQTDCEKLVGLMVLTTYV